MLRAYAIEGIGDVQAGAVDQPIEGADKIDRLRRKATTFQADGVDAAEAERLVPGESIRWDILHDAEAGADHCVATDPLELVNTGQAADDHPVADLDMTA